MEVVCDLGFGACDFPASGRPYFVMELVKGIPITEYCDQCSLTTRERLNLFIRVCQAVQHAHQKGIIHRDIKPSNVLIAMQDGQPVPKVIDFGVAKALNQRLTEKTLQTGFTQMLGTPLYMSPEQAEMSPLEVDTRSDIYSLGVLLYELLTGTTPFEKERLSKASFDELRRIIREEEPPRPSARVSTLNPQWISTISDQRRIDPRKLGRSLSGDLDWIVMTALEKDRTRRYESASVLAADIQRYLQDEPVQACPPSAAYRLHKFARRNKGRLAVAAGLVLMLLVALGGIVGGVGWAMRDRAAVAEEVAREEMERQAELNTSIGQVVDEAQAEYQRGRPHEALATLQRAEGLLATVETRGDAELAHAVRRWRQDLEMVATVERIRLEGASVAEDGKVSWSATDRAYQQAFQQYGLDVESLETTQLAEYISARPICIELAIALDYWAYVRRQLPGTEESSWRRLIEAAQLADPHPVRNQLRSLWGRKTADVRDEIEELTNSLSGEPLQPTTITLFARVLHAAELPAQAETLLREGQERYPDDFWINFDLAFHLVTEEPVRAGEAAGYYRAALAVRPDHALVQSNLGFALAREGKTDDAERAHRRAIELAPNYGRAHLGLGILFHNQRKWPDAIAAFERAIQLEPQYASSYGVLAIILSNCEQQDLRDPTRAVELARKAVELVPREAWVWRALGCAEYRSSNWQASAEALERSCELQGNDLQGNAHQWLFLAMAYQQMGYPKIARQWYEKALAVERIWPDDLVRIARETALVLGAPDASGSATAPNTMALVRTRQAYDRGPVRIAVSPDEKTVATIGEIASNALLWDATLASARESFDGANNGLLGVRFSSDGRLLALTGNDGRLVVWDVHGRQRLFRHDDLGEYGWDVAFLPGDATLAVGIGGAPGNRLQVLDLSTQQIVDEYECPAIRCLDVSPDGRLLACALGWSRDEENILIVDRLNGSKRRLAGHPGGTETLRFLPGGAELISGGGDRIVRRWRIADGAELWASDEHPFPIEAVALSADGKWLASACAIFSKPELGGEVRLWDAASGKLLAATRQPGGACDVKFIASIHQRLIAGNRMGQVFLWELLEQSDDSAQAAPALTQPSAAGDTRLATGPSAEPDDEDTSEASTEQRSR